MKKLFNSKTPLDKNDRKNFQKGIRYFRREYLLYLMLVPGLTYILIFKYIPMGGIIIAFQDYGITSSIFTADFVGLENFENIFSSNSFQRALVNNIIISISKLLFGFPIPIILSLLINELRHLKYKKIVQTSVILPNFISWVVVAGLMYAILSPSSGAVKEIAEFFGYTGDIPNILTNKETFRAYLVFTHIWKGAGMGTIVYLAAITNVDPTLYEAAEIDGAGRWARMWYVTLACIRPVIITLLIFRVGELMYAGFDQVYAMSNDLVISVADIIDTYVYRIGLEQAKFDIATAAGLFQSFIGAVLVIATNFIARKIDEDGAVM